jgi:P2-related tail formation protein
MSDNKLIIPDSLSTAQHLVAFDQLAAERYSQLDLDRVVTYLIDIVSESALEHLANQFDVLGYKGYKQAATVAEKREIIKNAIELKRYMGTVWAVKQAMKSVGYGGAQLVEGAGVGPTGWAQFRVVSDLGENGGLTDNSAIELTALINEYKNVRSHLLDISYTANTQDFFGGLTDEFNIEFFADDISDTLGLGLPFRYDGTYQYNGTMRYDDDQNENFSITFQ